MSYEESSGSSVWLKALVTRDRIYVETLVVGCDESGKLGVEIGDARNSSQIWNLDVGDFHCAGISPYWPA